MLDRLNVFFPVNEYVNKVIQCFDLADLGLITGGELVKYLLDNFKSKNCDPFSKGYIIGNTKL